MGYDPLLRAERKSEKQTQVRTNQELGEQREKAKTVETTRQNAAKNFAAAMTQPVAEVPDKYRAFDGFLASAAKNEIKNDQMQETMDAIFDAIEKNPAQIPILLGPQLAKCRQQYEQDTFARHRQWLKEVPYLDFYNRAYQLVVIFAQKMQHDLVWKNNRPQQENNLGLEVKGSQDVSTTLDALYKELRGITGLKEYTQALATERFKPLKEFFDNAIKARGQNNTLDDRLTEKQANELKAILETEFKLDSLRLGGLPVGKPVEKLAAPKQPALLEAPKKTTGLPRSVSSLGGSSPGIELELPLIANEFKDTEEVKSEDKTSLAARKEADFALVFTSEWRTGLQEVVQQQAQPKENRVKLKLHDLTSFIDKKNLKDILDHLKAEQEKFQKACLEYEKSAGQLEANYEAAITHAKAAYQKAAENLNQVNGGVEIKATEDQLRLVGNLPMSDAVFFKNGKHLLHLVLEQYKKIIKKPIKDKKPDPQAAIFLKVITDLMERGASPYFVVADDNNNTNKKKNAFNVIWETELPDWDIFRLTFRHMPVFNPFTAKVCEFLTKVYCPSCKKMENDTINFYQQDLKAKCRQDLIIIGQVLWETGSKFNDKKLINLIKVLNGKPVLAGELAKLQPLGTLTAYKSTYFGDSKLYKGLLEIAGLTEKQVLEFFNLEENALTTAAPVASP